MGTYRYSKIMETFMKCYKPISGEWLTVGRKGGGEAFNTGHYHFISLKRKSTMRQMWQDIIIGLILVVGT